MHWETAAGREKDPEPGEQEQSTGKFHMLEGVIKKPNILCAEFTINKIWNKF